MNGVWGMAVALPLKMLPAEEGREDPSLRSG